MVAQAPRLAGAGRLRQDRGEVRNRKRHGPVNVALLRRLALDIARREPSEDTMRGKPKRGARNAEFLFNYFDPGRCMTGPKAIARSYPVLLKAVQRLIIIRMYSDHRPDCDRRNSHPAADFAKKLSGVDFKRLGECHGVFEGQVQPGCGSVASMLPRRGGRVSRSASTSRRRGARAPAVRPVTASASASAGVWRVRVRRRSRSTSRARASRPPTALDQGPGQAPSTAWGSRSPRGGE